MVDLGFFCITIFIHHGGLKMENQELLTLEEEAARLKVPPSWLYARTRIKGGDFPVIRVGKYCRFRHAEVMAWITGKSGADR